MLKSISVVSALLVMGLNTDSFSAQPQDQGAMVPFQGFVKKERKPMFTSQALRLRSEMETSSKRIEGACKAQGERYQETNKQVAAFLNAANERYISVMQSGERNILNAITELDSARVKFREEAKHLTDTKEGIDQYLQNVAAMLVAAKNSTIEDQLAAIGEINDFMDAKIAELPEQACRAGIAIKAMIDKINE